MNDARRIDLHCHSCFSDGGSTPEELVEVAASLGLAALALTDHDTVNGLERFQAAAQAHPELEAVNGVELSTLYNSRELHFIGLWLDPENAELLSFLARMRAARAERNELIARKLASLGFPVPLEELGAPDTSSLGRPHFARYILDHYEGFDSMQAVFDRLLKHGAAAFVQRKLPSPYEAITVIRAAGGLPIWAHPVYRCRNERAFVKRMLKRFVPAGLGGLECYYSMFGPPETALTLEMAELYDIAPSGGSDFHGKNSTVALGTGGGQLFVPDTLMPKLKEKLQASRADAASRKTSPAVG